MIRIRDRSDGTNDQHGDGGRDYRICAATKRCLANSSASYCKEAPTDVSAVEQRLSRQRGIRSRACGCRPFPTGGVTPPVNCQNRCVLIVAAFSGRFAGENACATKESTACKPRWGGLQPAKAFFSSSSLRDWLPHSSNSLTVFGENARISAKVGARVGLHPRATHPRAFTSSLRRSLCLAAGARP
jgi:hypothetical protein